MTGKPALHTPSRGAVPWGLVAVLTGFVLVALLYSIANPIFEAPDEIQHFYYVRHIARTGTLAVQVPEQVALYRQEGSQPPLYYLLGGALTSWIDTSDAETSIRENPHVNLGVPQAFGNKNAVVHTQSEAFPYRGVPLAVHVLRLLSIGLGALTVWAAYALGREVFPDRPAIALLAAALTAFLPQFLFISGAISNDIAVATTASWAVVLLVRSVRLGFAWRRSVALGVLVGLAALSKLSGLSVLALVGLGLLFWAWQEQRGWDALCHGLIVLATATVVGGWWYARNWILYGDPLGMQTMLDMVGRRDTFGLSDLLFELEGLRLSFWGLFGWFNVLMAQWAYAVYDIVAVVGLLGLVGLLAKEAVARSESRQRLALPVGLILWVLLVFASLIYWTSSTTGSQGRLLFVTLPATCVLWAAGLIALVPRRFERSGTIVLAVLWLGLALSAPFLYIEPAYARPTMLDMDTLPADLERIDVTFDNKIALLGYSMPERTIRRGTPLHINLCWRSLEELDRDYTVFIHLFGRNDVSIGQEDTYPGRGNYPTSEWTPGAVFCDAYDVLVEPAAKAPAAATVDVGIYDMDTRERLQAYDRDLNPLERVLLAPVKVTTWAPHEYAVAHPVDYALGTDIRLIGYKAEEASGASGNTLKIALYWQVDATPAEDYTVFVHLLDATGTLVAQHDGQPVDASYPTSLWEPGEIVKDEHNVALPAEQARGEYHLQVGMYRASDGQRLPIKDEKRQDIGNAVPLAVVPLSGPQ